MEFVPLAALIGYTLAITICAASRNLWLTSGTTLIVLALHGLSLLVYGATTDALFLVTLGYPVVSLVAVVALIRAKWVQGGIPLARWRAVRAALLVSIIGLNLAYTRPIGLGDVLVNVGQRWRVARSVDLDEFQRCAIELAQKPGTEIPSAGWLYRQVDALPEAVRRLRPHHVSVAADASGERYVTLAYGLRGILSYGILIGPRTFRSRGDGSRRVFHWRDGVYGFCQPGYN